MNPLTESALLKEPWAPTCALLVFPGGADLGYCRVLNGAGNRTIAQYVRRGGAYLGFCAGGYYGSRRCEFEVGNPALEVVGSRELAFFPGTCRGGAFKGFEYHSEKGARAANISVSKGAFDDSESLPDEFRCYYNGGGVFVDADKLASESSNVQILAEYTGDIDVESGAAKPAIVYCKVGEGCAILTGPHPEYFLPPPPLAVVFRDQLTRPDSTLLTSASNPTSLVTRSSSRHSRRTKKPGLPS